MLIDYIIAGILASLVVLSIAGDVLLLPSLSSGQIRMGFAGTLVVGIAAAVVWDTNFQHSFVASFFSVAAVRLSSNLMTSSGGIRTWRNDNDRERLDMLRRKLRIAEQNSSYYGPGEVPLHLQLIIEELKREIEELERRQE